MKLPKEMTNEELAMHVEFWFTVNQDLSEIQKAFFEEVVFRLRLMFNSEERVEPNAG